MKENKQGLHVILIPLLPNTTNLWEIITAKEFLKRFVIEMNKLNMISYSILSNDDSKIGLIKIGGKFVNNKLQVIRLNIK